MKFGLRKTIQFSPEMWEEIRKIAYQHNVTASEVIRKCVDRCILNGAIRSMGRDDEET
jgi:hypothetical protein